MPPTVLLMLKAPTAGAVKTRLGRDLGMPAAAAIYRRLVEHQMNQLPPGWPVRICFAPAEAPSAMQDWLGESHAYSPQVEGDLGERLTDAAKTHFAATDAPLAIVGGDCPALTRAVFLRLPELLSRHDVILVPADDGGYCLIAMRRFVPEAFQRIPWSTAAVLDETRARLAASDRSWNELEPMEDVDDLPSWRRAVAAFPALGAGDCG
ncbi:MAG TPA: TIGR04282 family arsenosugar biosynthesis glycosyltransferase [Chthoniobacteraceae bacterium]|jgi:hypothetical protein